MLFRGNDPYYACIFSRANSLSSALASGNYSVLTITCRGDIYTVRKLIACTRAGFFARAVKFGGKVWVSNALAVLL
jgi:hypothetical protein